MLEDADDDFDILEMLDEFSDLSVGQAAKKVREMQFAREINEHRVGILSMYSFSNGCYIYMLHPHLLY